MFVKRVENPKDIDHILHRIGLDDLKERGYVIVRENDLQTLEKLSVIGWEYAEIESQVLVPGPEQNINNLYDMNGEFENRQDIETRLKEIFQ